MKHIFIFILMLVGMPGHQARARDNHRPAQHPFDIHLLNGHYRPIRCIKDGKGESSVGSAFSLVAEGTDLVIDYDDLKLSNKISLYSQINEKPKRDHYFGSTGISQTESRTFTTENGLYAEKYTSAKMSVFGKKYWANTINSLSLNGASLELDTIEDSNEYRTGQSFRNLHCEYQRD